MVRTVMATKTRSELGECRGFVSGMWPQQFLYGTDAVWNMSRVLYNMSGEFNGMEYSLGKPSEARVVMFVYVD